MSSVVVRELEDVHASAWDDFVHAQPDGTFFHLSAWRRLVCDVFGHSAHYLASYEQGQLTGVLPLVHQRSLLFGNSLISTPFCVYGGIVAATAAAQAALERSAIELAARLRVDYLEMRNRRLTQDAWPTKDLYVTFRRELSADHDENMKAIPRKQRAMVRGGIDAGLRSEIDPGVDRLYAAYSESVRNLGTPVFPKKYFAALREVFGEACEVLTVLKDDEVVSSVLSFYFRDEVLPYYGGGTRRARELKANDFMHWEVMRRAVDRGIRVFDFGRSKSGSGSYRFKKHWGFTPAPLHYQYHLVRSREMPNLSPNNPKYRMLVGAWQRLPLGLSRLLGPMLARHLG